MVPTHDTRELTRACLASLAAVRGPLEVVVVDDGSRDDTAELVRSEYPQVRLLRHERARGFSAAANAGLAAATGELLWLLNSDTLAPADSLERLTAAFAARPRTGVLGSELVYPDGRPQWSAGPRPSPAWLFAVASGLPAVLRAARERRAARATHAAAQGVRLSWPAAPAWVSGASLVVRRAAWHAAGPLDEGYRFYAQDIELCLRARRAGYGVAVLPGWRVVHALGGTIGRGDEACQGARLEFLFPDLVRCVERLEGARAARHAAAALRAGARLRLARLRWRAETRRGPTAAEALHEAQLVERALAALAGAGA